MSVGFIALIVLFALLSAVGILLDADGNLLRHRGAAASPGAGAGVGSAAREHAV